MGFHRKRLSQTAIPGPAGSQDQPKSSTELGWDVRRGGWILVLIGVVLVLVAIALLVFY